MALINDEMTVSRNLIRHLSLPNKTLNQSDINSPCRFAATATDSANVIDIDRQKLPKALDPLFQQFFAMDQDERVDSSAGNQCRGNHGFAKGSRCRQDTTVVARQCVNSTLLLIPKRTHKTAVEFRTTFSQILNVSFNVVRS